MKVSIVTVVINCEEFIDSCIQSVLSQDYGDIEYIIVDGLSTDRTTDIVKSYKEKIHVFVSEKDEGLYYALNKGIARATGDIVGILNADDVFASRHVISAIVDCFLSAQCDAVYGNMDMTVRNGSERILRRWRSRPYRLLDLKLGWMPAHPTFYIKRLVLTRYEAYRPEFGISADYEWMLRLLYRHRIRTVFLKQTLIRMRSGGKSNGSAGKLLDTIVTDFKAMKENNLSFPLVIALLKKFRKIGQYISHN